MFNLDPLKTSQFLYIGSGIFGIVPEAEKASDLIQAETHLLCPLNKSQTGKILVAV